MPVGNARILPPLTPHPSCGTEVPRLSHHISSSTFPPLSHPHPPLFHLTTTAQHSTAANMASSSNQEPLTIETPIAVYADFCLIPVGSLPLISGGAHAATDEDAKDWDRGYFGFETCCGCSTTFEEEWAELSYAQRGDYCRLVLREGPRQSYSQFLVVRELIRISYRRGLLGGCYSGDWPGSFYAPCSRYLEGAY